jgi:hypothetical protein
VRRRFGQARWIQASSGLRASSTSGEALGPGQNPAYRPTRYHHAGGGSYITGQIIGVNGGMYI